MTDPHQDRRKIHDIAVVACAAVGTGTGTGLIMGSPLYAITRMEDRAFNRQGVNPLTDNADVIAIGALGVLLGAYVMHKTTRWLYERIYG